nr:outer membrane protein assembly factor BamD [bacterium]
LTSYEKGDYDEAAVEFELFLEFHPGHKMAPKAQYYVAMSKFNSYPSPERDITLAREAKSELEQFLRTYPDHPDVEQVRSYRIEVIDHLQTHEIEVARVYYRRGNYTAALLRLDPIQKTEASPEIKQEALYLTARTYEKQDDPENARVYYQQVIDTGIDNDLSEKARRELNRF